MLLSVTDRDFAEEFSRCLAKILRKSNRYKVRWSEKRKRWIVQGSSIFLHRFLRGGWRRLKRYIEHCYLCRASFLRAMFDGEGTIGRNRISIYNTDLRLLLYIRRLLFKFGIETGNPSVHSRAGSILKDPRTDIFYERRRDCYTLAIRINGSPLFARHIGFSIKRKSRLLPQPLAQVVLENLSILYPSHRKLKAGPVGFEPTILGSEGPRLGPGSTTGP
jgi:intein-encoded DNA endonuclease-like protein